MSPTANQFEQLALTLSSLNEKQLIELFSTLSDEDFSQKINKAAIESKKVLAIKMAKERATELDGSCVKEPPMPAYSKAVKIVTGPFNNDAIAAFLSLAQIGMSPASPTPKGQPSLMEHIAFYLEPKERVDNEWVKWLLKEGYRATPKDFITYEKLSTYRKKKFRALSDDRVFHDMVRSTVLPHGMFAKNVEDESAGQINVLDVLIQKDSRKITRADFFSLAKSLVENGAPYPKPNGLVRYETCVIDERFFYWERMATMSCNEPEKTNGQSLPSGKLEKLALFGAILNRASLEFGLEKGDYRIPSGLCISEPHRREFKKNVELPFPQAFLSVSVSDEAMPLVFNLFAKTFGLSEDCFGRTCLYMLNEKINQSASRDNKELPFIIEAAKVAIELGDPIDSIAKLSPMAKIHSLDFRDFIKAAMEAKEFDSALSASNPISKQLLKKRI